MPLASIFFFQQLIECGQFDVYHVLDHQIDNLLLLCFHIIDTQYLIIYFLIAHPIVMGNLESIFVQQRNVENLFQLIVAVVSDIGIGSLWL